MTKELSILKTDDDASLTTQRSDMASAFFKGLAGAAPLVGPFLAEAVGALIPNQKLDRLIAFSKVLNDRIKYLEDNTVELKMRTEEYTDLLEEGLTQAAKAMTEERRGYIASLLTNSITNEQLTHVEEKKLLTLLGELNDAEILTLKFYSLRSYKRQEFAELHADLFAPIHRSLGAPQTNIDKGAMRDSYRTKLAELGLLDLEYKRLSRGQLPEFDERTGKIKAQGYRVTSLGKLLLRSIEKEPERSSDDLNV